jgi:hypothetical protein
VLCFEKESAGPGVETLQYGPVSVSGRAALRAVKLNPACRISASDLISPFWGSDQIFHQPYLFHVYSRSERTLRSVADALPGPKFTQRNKRTDFMQRITCCNCGE